MSRPIAAIAELRGERVAVLGTGREGRSAARALVRAGADVVAFDDRAAGEEWVAEFGDSVPVERPGESQRTIEPEEGARASEGLPGTFALAIKSPGIPPTAPLVRAFAEAGVAVTSLVDLWLREAAPRTIGVTGTKGKSTTATLIHALLVATGREALLGGNMGIPVADLPEAPAYVIELSSYQAQSISRSPRIVVLTSLYPEHLDWHGGESAYYRDKLNAIGHDPAHVIVNAHDEHLVEVVRRLHPGAPITLVGEAGSVRTREIDGEPWHVQGDAPLFPTATSPLRGEHNTQNVNLALQALAAAGVDLVRERDAIAAGLAGFAPLEHRLEELPDAQGITFVDDLLSTTPHSAIRALSAYAHREVTLIVGGFDRGIDYDVLAEHLAAHPVNAVIAVPQNGARILERLRASGSAVTGPSAPGSDASAIVGGEDATTRPATSTPPAPAAHLLEAADLDDAVALARRVTPDGGIVLLSPAAPSYGLYRDFADKAEHFRRAIAQTAAPKE